MDEAMNEIPKIVSRDNQHLVHARKVRDGKVSEQMFIEGRRLVNEALSSDLLIDETKPRDKYYSREMREARRQDIRLLQDFINKHEQHDSFI